MSANEDTVQLNVLAQRLRRARTLGQLKQHNARLIELDGRIDRVPTINRITLHYLRGVVYMKTGLIHVEHTKDPARAKRTLAKATQQFGFAVRHINDLRGFVSHEAGAQQRAILQTAAILERNATYESQVALSALKVIGGPLDSNMTMLGLECLTSQSRAKINMAFKRHEILASRF